MPSSAKPLAVAGLGVSLVAVLGAYLTDLGPWYEHLLKPAWQPPDVAFGPAWTVILTLCAISAANVWSRAPDRGGRNWFAIDFALNMNLNVLWTTLFFAAKRPDWALIEVGFLWLSIVGLMLPTWRYARSSAWLLAPYLTWVSFAAALNIAIVRLNPPFGPTT